MVRHPNPDDVLAQARSVTVTLDHYERQIARLRAELAAGEVPITAEDFLPAGPDPYADQAPVF
jgi:hypothetical protein